MQLLDLTPGQVIRIGKDIRLTVIRQDDGTIGFEFETNSPVHILPGEFVGLELHQLQTLSASDL